MPEQEELGLTDKPEIELAVEIAEVLNFASVVNKIPILYRLEILNHSDADLDDFALVVTSIPALIKPKTLYISSIKAGHKHVLESVDLVTDNEKLMALNEAIPIQLTIAVQSNEQTLASKEIAIEAVAYEQWPGERLMPQLLAAFCQPNTKATAGIQKNAATLLLQANGNQLNGYQSTDRREVAMQVAAVFSAISKMGISYANPPAGLAAYGQRIRTPARIVEDSLATCLDTTLLLASVLESIGLHSVLLLSHNHAWVACWLTQNALTETCTTDAQVIRKRLSAGEMIAVETTLVCEGNQSTFGTAIARGSERLDPERYDDFSFAIDVQRARHQKILPLPSPGEHREDRPPEEVAAIDRMEIEALVLPELAEEAEPEVKADSSNTLERIEQWKSQLLDHSMRNRLLNCTPGKFTVRFIHPNAGEIEDLLADGKDLTIDSLMDHVINNDPRNENLLTQHGDRGYRDELASQALMRHRIVSLLEKERNQSQMTKLFRDAKNNEEETGSNTLYLCIGSLIWRPVGKDKEYQAPLLMLPVRLKRKSVSSAFRLGRHDDDPILNPTLLQVLQEQFAIRVHDIPAPHALPTDDYGVDVPRILSLVQAAVAEQQHMEVRPDVIQLGNFSFAKYLLWMDLNNKTEELLRHPLVDLMVTGNKDAAETLVGHEFIDRNELDEKVDVGELHLVTMADASQQVVLHEAGKGRSFVVEGPPGTGKSETITNLIADQLGRGKRVLFVSEKMEALEVVHSRLCKVGLEPFLLVLHAAKANKKQVIAQYAKAVDAAHARRPQGWEQIRDQLRNKRKQLNDYVNVLHSPQSAGLTVHQAISILARRPDWKPAKLSWPGIESVDAETMATMTQRAKDMGVLAAEFGGFDDRSLRSIAVTSFTPSWADSLLEQATAYQQAFEAMHKAMVKLAAQFKISELRWTPSDYDQLTDLFRGLLNPPALITELTGAGGTEQLVEQLKATVTSIDSRNAQAKALADQWIDDALKLDPVGLKQAWRSAIAKFWPLSWFASMGVRGQLAPYAKSGKRPVPETVIPFLDAVEALQTQDRLLAEMRPKAVEILGEHYGGLETDTSRLEKIRRWLEVLDPLLAKSITDGAARWRYLKALIPFVARHHEQFNSTGPYGQALQGAISAKNAHDEILIRLCETAGCSIEQIKANEPNRLLDWADETRGWAPARNRLQPWCVWQRVRGEAITSGLGPLVTALEAGGIDPNDVQAFFEFSFANWWLNQMVERTPLLQNFSRPLHEKAIEDFRDLDGRFIEATRSEIFARLAANVPRADINIPGSPMGFLRDQMVRQRNHRPVREIMQKLGDQNVRLKPCMMMSPLTVAQYLEVADTRFDIVVFDEASQIRTCDAIGVIARAPQVIVVGDSKQLPPTSFFATGNTNDDAQIQDHEAILDQCASILPSHRLSWHYRSRNEELIAFSNDRYYEGELITMPAPTTLKAVRMHKVPGVYDRGASRTNRIEAEAVVQFLRQRTLSSGTRRQSIGVVTFSAAQQTLIQDLLERECAADPQLERAVKGDYNDDKQELFIKNLESVQGDQRDCIVFSVGYGPTSTGTVFNEFGPVNRDGGQRRLNVAVTRAAEEVHVFASMDPEDIKSAYLQDSGSGVGDLKRYLMFARDGVQVLESYASPTGRDVDSSFEAQVLKRLQAKGWDMHLQVGVSKFRIDLAAIDPRKPGRYLAGIECDGATYHSSATARDRDVVRQEVLERLGWKILRIWSTDWWNNADAEVERIHSALLSLQNEPISEPEDEDFAFDPGAAPIDEDGSEDADSDSDDEPDADGQSAELLRAGGAGERVHIQYPEYMDAVVPDLGMEPYDYRAAGVAKKQAEDLLVQCAPMMEEILYRKILEGFGQKRLTARASEALSQYLQGLPTTREGDTRIFWESSTQAENYSSFRVGNSRVIGEIPLVELANLASELLSHAMQCGREDLAKAMSDKLGTRRMSADILARLQQSLDLLIETGRAQQAGDGAIRHLVSQAE